MEPFGAGSGASAPQQERSLVAAVGRLNRCIGACHQLNDRFHVALNRLELAPPPSPNAPQAEKIAGEQPTLIRLNECLSRLENELHIYESSLSRAEGVF